jgi:hypothetical protein
MSAPSIIPDDSLRVAVSSAAEPAPPKSGDVASRKTNAARTHTQAVLDRGLEWREDAKHWMASYRGLAYGFSLGLHLVVLIVASFLLVRSMALGVGQGEGDGLFGQMTGDDLVLFDSVDTQLEEPGGGVETIELPQLQSVTEVAPQETAAANLLADIGSLVAKPSGQAAEEKAGGGGGGQFGSGGAGGGLKFRMPGGGRAVVKGSFTVWTVPEDPNPYQDYLIIIQVRLPKNTRQYERNDLSGIVIGTDKYEQTLPGFGLPRGRLLPIKDDVAQLAVPVPGAERLVKDSITVESKLLKEKQQIEIVF